MRKINLINKDGLSVDDLKKVKRSVPKELRNRIQAIILIMQGWQAKQVAQFMDLTDQTIRRYVRSFNEGGVEKLLHVEPKPGRTPKLTEEQKKEVIEVIKKSPAEVGFGEQNVWYYKLISAYIKEKYGVEITDEGVRLMIRNMQGKFRHAPISYILKRKRNKVSGF